MRLDREPISLAKFYCRSHRKEILIHPEPETKRIAPSRTNDKPVSTWLKEVRQFANSALFSYTTIFLLQLKILWGMWLAQELTGGDTSGYFAQSMDFFQRGQVLFAWSPMYTSFCGLLLNISNDAFANIILQRMIISLTICMLFLALTRRLLPKEIAWFTVVWWVVLPINFNPRYEVHEFAVIPVLVALLISLSKNKKIARVATSSALWISAALMRNELAVAALLFTTISICYEILIERKIDKRPLAKVFLPYGLAALCVLSTVGLAYQASNAKGKELAFNFHTKEAVNVSQTFAYSYKQRHPEWNKDPFMHFGELSKETFGTDEPSMLQAITRNPIAMAQFYAWNLHLIPNGLEVLLFNVSATTDNPDYSPIHVNFWRATVLFSLLIVGLLFGIRKTILERSVLWRSYGRERFWCFVAMACVASTSLICILTQRPRPSYIFILGMIIMFLSGFSLWRIFRQSPLVPFLSTACLPVMCATLLFMPWYYMEKFKHSTNWDQYYADEYHQLKPWAKSIAKDKRNVLVQTEFNDGLSAYLWGMAPPRGSIFIRRIADFNKELEKNSIDEVARKENVGWLLIDEYSHPEPAFAGFSQGKPPKGWDLMAMQRLRFGRMMLFRRTN